MLKYTIILLFSCFSCHGYQDTTENAKSSALFSAKIEKLHFIKFDRQLSANTAQFKTLLSHSACNGAEIKTQMNCESLGNICTLRLFFDENQSCSMRTAEQFFVVDLTLLKNGASLIADHRYLIGVGSHKLAFEAPQLLSRNDPKFSRNLRSAVDKYINPAIENGSERITVNHGSYIIEKSKEFVALHYLQRQEFSRISWQTSVYCNLADGICNWNSIDKKFLISDKAAELLIDDVLLGDPKNPYKKKACGRKNDGTVDPDHFRFEFLFSNVAVFPNYNYWCGSRQLIGQRLANCQAVELSKLPDWPSALSMPVREAHCPENN